MLLASSVALLATIVCILAILKRGWIVPLVLIYAVLPLRAWTETEFRAPLLGSVVLDSAIAMLIAILLICRILVSPAPRALGVTRISLALIFLGCGVVSAMIVGSVGDVSGFRMLLRLAYPILVFFVVLFDCARNEKKHLVVDGLLVLGVVVTLAVAVASVAGMSLWRWSAGVDRFSGLGSISDYSYLMGMFVILAYVKFRLNPRKVLYGLLLVVFAAQLLLTVTRGGIFATVLALVVIELLGGWSRISGRMLMLAMVVVSISCAVVFYEPLQSRIFATHYSDTASLRYSGLSSGLAESFSMSGRERLWDYVLGKVFADHHILFGYGLGRGEVDIGNDVGAAPHNEYIRVLYEMGVAGLVVFSFSILQLGSIARSGIRYSKENDAARTIALACLGMVVLYASGATVDNMINKYKNMGAPMFALVALVLLQLRERRRLISQGQSTGNKRSFR